MLFALILLGLLALGAAGCIELVPPPPTPTPLPTPTPTETPTPTITPLPTATPPPTETPTPLPTPTPPGPVRTPVAGDAAVAFNAMLDAMDVATSYRFQLALAFGAEGGPGPLLTGEGEYQAPDRLHYTYQSIGLPLEVLAIGADTYLRLPDGSWQRGTVDPAGDPLRAALNVRHLVGLLTYAAEARLVGDEPLPGGDTPSRRLAFTLAPSALGAASQLGWTGAGGDVWLAPATARLLRLRLAFTGADGAGAGNGVVTIDFRDYDAPIAIEAPGP